MTTPTLEWLELVDGPGLMAEYDVAFRDLAAVGISSPFGAVSNEMWQERSNRWNAARIEIGRRLDDLADIRHAELRHPGYEYETTTGPHKTWADADKPPVGDGWERNTALGYNGFERFEYSEESYWRRKKVDAT